MNTATLTAEKPVIVGPLVRISLGSEHDLPNFEICSAEPTGWADVAECTMPGAPGCPHAVEYGGSFLCGHAQRAQIVAITRQRRQ